MRGEHGWPVDAVADHWPVPPVHQQGEDGVHHVVVERSAAAGPVTFAAPGGKLDLQERTLLRIRLGDVDDEVVREDQLGPRVRAVRPGVVTPSSTAHRQADNSADAVAGRWGAQMRQAAELAAYPATT
jgi:hypothetical protein